jgi:hypothetical protein
MKRSNYRTLEMTIKSISDGSKASLTLCVGYLLKTAIKVMKGVYLSSCDDASADEVDRFMGVLQLNWGYLFSGSMSAIALKRQEKLRKPAELPLESDITTLRNYTLSQIRAMLSDELLHWSSYEFNRLRSLVVSRLTLFNARRGGEPARLHLQEWLDAENDSWIDKQLVMNVDDPLEKELLGKFKLAFQPGKGSRSLVPVLIPLDTVEAVRKLVDIRTAVGVNIENPYLFPYTQKSDGFVSGWHSVHEVSSAAGVQFPARLTATRMRHRASTLYALEDVPDKERDAFYRHMGHGKGINEAVYQCPLAIEEVCKVGKYLSKLDRTVTASDSLKKSTTQDQCDITTEPRCNLLSRSVVAVSAAVSAAYAAPLSTCRKRSATPGSDDNRSATPTNPVIMNDKGKAISDFDSNMRLESEQGPHSINLQSPSAVACDFNIPTNEGSLPSSDEEYFPGKNDIRLMDNIM